MLDNMQFRPQEQLPSHDITSPLEGQLLELEFSESDFFQKTLHNHNSKIASSSNCCYGSDNPLIENNISNRNKEINQTMNDHISTDPSSSIQNRHRPPIFDEVGSTNQIEQHILASVEFSTSPTFSIPSNRYNLELYNTSSLNNNHFTLGDHQIETEPMPAATIHGNEQWQAMAAQPPPVVVPGLGSTISTGYEDNSPPLPSIASTSYFSLRNSTIMDPTITPFLTINPSFSAENPGIFSGRGLMLGNDLPSQELDFQGEDNGAHFLIPDAMHRILNCTSEHQGLSSQHIVHGGTSSMTPLDSDISNFNNPCFKVGKLSVEERERKIHRYKMKRNERNFSKKIKYACRKTLADSRPRVRGRFAKNDELGDFTLINGENHQEDDQISIFSNSMPDHQRMMGMNDGDAMDSPDIFAHISGVNSFKCSYPIQSWI